MRLCKSGPYWILVLSLCVPGLAAQAQEAPVVRLKEVVVTATRTAQPVGDLVADLTIMDREAIERAGAVGLVDLLARVPGFEFVRNGGVGNTLSLIHI